MQIEYIPAKDLTPYPQNAKKHDKKQVANVAESIKRYGWVQPLVIDKDNVIVIGHCRALAAKKLGIKQLPCVRVNDLTDDQVRALRLVDNKTNESEWDLDLLAEEFPGLELDGFDFDWGILEDSEPVKIKEDTPPDVAAEGNPVVQPGDVWRLGRHLLYCGDSTSAEEVQGFIGGAQIDVVMTDPPYDMDDIGGGGCFVDSVARCKGRIKDIIHFDPHVIGWWPSLGINSFYIFSSKQGVGKYLDIFADYNYDILFWAKTNPAPFTSGTFIPGLEYMLYFSKKGRIWNNSLKPTDVYKKYYISDKKQVTKEAGGDLHPTIKPMQLIADKLRISSREGGIVLDPFGGSGTTLAVCEQIGRTCYTIEINPEYCDVIIGRWENMTGWKAERIKSSK